MSDLPESDQTPDGALAGDVVERMAEAAVRDYNLSTEQRWVQWS